MASNFFSDSVRVSQGEIEVEGPTASSFEGICEEEDGFGVIEEDFFFLLGGE